MKVYKFYLGQLFMFKKILTNQNECTQMRIDFDQL